MQIGMFVHFLSSSADFPSISPIACSRAPISLPAISCERETSWREIIRIFETNAYDGLVVSIPSAIGSLQLLFDPLGLVRSLRRGLFDMVHLPLLGIQEKSLSHFIAGLHQGSASLLKELSGWLMMNCLLSLYIIAVIFTMWIEFQVGVSLPSGDSQQL